MEIDKDKIVTIEGSAKERVAHGLQDKELEREARELKDEGEREMDEARENS